MWTHNPDPSQLYKSKRIICNSLYNIIGQILPLIAALIAIPLLIQNIGKERFGILSIGWMLMGYFSLFDLGLARVMTKLIGEKLGEHKKSDIQDIFWGGLFFLLVLGLFAGGLLYLFSPCIVTHVLNIPNHLLRETRISFFILSAGVPLVTTTTGLRGTLEAYQKFGVINIVRSLNGLLLFCTPLLLIRFTSALPYYILAIIFVRLIVGFFYSLIVLRTLPVTENIHTTFRFISSMFRQGIWMSISNIIGPVMVYFDRFFIGAWLSLTAVTYYVTPYEIVTKTMLLTTALIRVLFPAFSTSLSVDPRHTRQLYSYGMRGLLFILFPIIILLIVLAEPGLHLWLGKEFADKGTRVAQWLAIGCMINAPAQVAFSLIQAAGRADFTAKLHLVEMPFYLILLYVLIMRWGIAGAALAWSLRALIDCTILISFADRRLLLKETYRTLYVFFLLSTGAAFSITALKGTGLIITGLIIIGLFIILYWFVLLNPAEKKQLRNFVCNKRLLKK